MGAEGCAQAMERALRLEQAMGQSAATRTGYGAECCGWNMIWGQAQRLVQTCSLGNSTFGKLPLEKMPLYLSSKL